MIADNERDQYLYEDPGCNCLECQTRQWIYPYPLGHVTEYARSYVNNNQITFITNTDCNINCKHCFIPAAFPDRPKGFISRDIVDKTFEMIGDRKVVISILGGEVMLYPEECKYIADKAHEKGLTFRLITNGYFGNDQKMIDYLVNEIKPEIITISVDEYHQEFIPIETIKNLINNIYGKIEIIIESCMDVKNENFDFDAEPRKKEIIEQLGLQKKKIFFLIDAIKKDGNARDNDLGYEKTLCPEGHCSSCGAVVVFNGRISIKCEFNSRPIHEDCKAWTKNIITDDFDFGKFKEFLKTKRWWISERVITENHMMLDGSKYTVNHNLK